jgi:hypothetical protein
LRQFVAACIYVWAIAMRRCKRTLTVSSRCGRATGCLQKGGGTGGGDYFLIFFFSGTALYLIGGMLMNHSKTGTPRIPHIETWKSVPGLVMDGISFTVFQRCGTAKGSGTYAEFGANPDNTYGSL